ncbi:GGDEF domain-containing protein [Chloroflexota bacterium]
MADLKIYRYGIDEFIILMTGIEKEEASLVALRLQKEIGDELFKGESENQPSRNMTTSIGLAAFPSDAQQANELIEAANSALYRAKKSGGNVVCFA